MATMRMAGEIRKGDTVEVVSTRKTLASYSGMTGRVLDVTTYSDKSQWVRVTFPFCGDLAGFLPSELRRV